MGVILKDGSEVEDARLDRIIQFDERSKQYPLSWFWSGKTKKPRSYTWRCNDFLNQGREGSCVGHGIAHELIARPSEVEGITHSYAKERIYWEAQKIDPWEGGAYPGATRRYEGTTVLAGVKVARKLGWFDSYRWAFGLEDLIMGVGHNGPAVLGLRWFEGMRNVDINGYIKPIGKCVGGHCILCNAVNVKEQRFTLHNSWGINWGVNGECYITFDDMDKLLKQDGEAVFFQKRHKKAKIRRS